MKNVFRACGASAEQAAQHLGFLGWEECFLKVAHERCLVSFNDECGPDKVFMGWGKQLPNEGTRAPSQASHFPYECLTKDHTL